MTAAHAYELPPKNAGGFRLPDAEVEAVEEGGEVIYLTRSGRPVARITPVDPEQA
ncbi:MAG: type II toxin-antitoxin system prevent-host-death family antitoxin, partial [Mycobacteriales bacterium]